MAYEIQETIKVKSVQLEGIVETIEPMPEEWYKEAARQGNKLFGRYFNIKTSFENPKYGGPFSVKEECVPENYLGFKQLQIGSVHRENYVVYEGKLFRHWQVPVRHGHQQELISPIDQSQIRAYWIEVDDAEKLPTKVIADKLLSESPLDAEGSPVRHYAGNLDFFRDLDLNLGEYQHVWMIIDSSFRDLARYLFKTGSKNPLKTNGIDLPCRLQFYVSYGGVYQGMPFSILRNTPQSFLEAVPLVEMAVGKDGKTEGSVHIDYDTNRIEIWLHDEINDQKWVELKSDLQHRGLVSEYSSIGSKNWPQLGDIKNSNRINRKKVALEVMQSLEEHFEGYLFGVGKVLTINRKALERMPPTFHDCYLGGESEIESPQFTLSHTPPYQLIKVTNGGLETTTKLWNALRDFAKDKKIVTYFMEVK
mgnify:CR=1 FL=1